jgi:indolepyruvate ferredoxin oxidoreductase beta subunit
MPEVNQVTSIVVVGLGGQGVLKASDITAEAAFIAGHDVKKAEVHGMSQRGGVVTSDVRFGPQVLSPMVPPGEADYVVMLDASAHERCLALVGAEGRIIGPDEVTLERLPQRRCLNVALLGSLSQLVSAPAELWEAAIQRNFRPRLHAVNLRSFALGRCARRVA